MNCKRHTLVDITQLKFRINKHTNGMESDRKCTVDTGKERKQQNECSTMTMADVDFQPIQTQMSYMPLPPLLY